MIAVGLTSAPVSNLQDFGFSSAHGAVTILTSIEYSKSLDLTKWSMLTTLTWQSEWWNPTVSGTGQSICYFIFTLRSVCNVNAVAGNFASPLVFLLSWCFASNTKVADRRSEINTQRKVFPLSNVFRYSVVFFFTDGWRLALWRASRLLEENVAGLSFCENVAEESGDQNLW